MREVINTILLLLMVGWTAMTGSHSQESPKKQTALGVQQDYQIVKPPKVITAAQQAKIDADAALAQEVLNEAGSRLAEQKKYDALIATAGRTGVNWNAIAFCETEGNWQMSGPRYSGGVGFANSTWTGAMHGKWIWSNYRDLGFAENAGDASREEQIIVAERVYDKLGLSGWGCKAYG